MHAYPSNNHTSNLHAHALQERFEESLHVHDLPNIEERKCCILELIQGIYERCNKHFYRCKNVQNMHEKASRLYKNNTQIIIINFTEIN